MILKGSNCGRRRRRGRRKEEGGEIDEGKSYYSMLFL